MTRQQIRIGNLGCLNEFSINQDVQVTIGLILYGAHDFRVPVAEGLQLFTTLQRLGVPSRLINFPDEGHWVLKPQNTVLWYSTFLDWIGQWTKTP